MSDIKKSLCDQKQIKSDDTTKEDTIITIHVVKSDNKQQMPLITNEVKTDDNNETTICHILTYILQPICALLLFVFILYAPCNLFQTIIFDAFLVCWPIMTAVLILNYIINIAKIESKLKFVCCCATLLLISMLSASLVIYAQLHHCGISL
jgi:hypothetical protein